MKTAIVTRNVSELGRSRPKLWTSVIREGVAAGTLSAAAVALWYLIWDSIGGRPLHTPALLGAFFFNGLRGHDVGAPALAPVLSFMVLHFVAFIAFGLASALIVNAAKREPLLMLAAPMVYVCYEICFLGFVTVLDAAVLESLGWWKIAAANGVTLVTLFTYFQYMHPETLRRFSERWEQFDTTQSASLVRQLEIQLAEEGASTRYYKNTA